jgi:hypothetical protein
MPEHRYVMETILNRRLTAREYVHHRNRNKHDNRPENLEVLDIREHGRISSAHKGIPIPVID